MLVILLGSITIQFVLLSIKYFYGAIIQRPSNYAKYCLINIYGRISRYLYYILILILYRNI